MNVIPIDRNGPDRAALRIAVRRLKDKRIVGIFPEGGIRDGASSILNGAEMKHGVSLLCALSDAPLVPCVILGSDRLYNFRNWLPWRRPGIWIGYGRPILPSNEPPGESKKDRVRRLFAAEIVELKLRLCNDFRFDRGGSAAPSSGAHGGAPFRRRTAMNVPRGRVGKWRL